MKIFENNEENAEEPILAKIEGSSALSKITLLLRIKGARNAISIALGIDEKKILIKGITLLVEATRKQLRAAKFEIELQFMRVTGIESLLLNTV